ncbi:GTP:adenosylcobinamide-phosphate guanylyltransferase [Rhodoligotrophos appendicifer]|uniref:nucleotidyltransferase family protein n=1 Tax=Rhodoligotrophos appendicifer TaxID=987056 RepID=UPI001185CA0F|nr:nucleotidyltransferase family protein [Rhodoligotrophos appendicifer]
MTTEPLWKALVLAAGRGPHDPMAKAYDVSHKCGIEIAGIPMLVRVLQVLRNSPQIGEIVISIDSPEIGIDLAERAQVDVTVMRSSSSAPASVIDAAGQMTYPLLVTTADHPLLTVEMIDYFITRSSASGADLTAGLASAETIMTAYPSSKRTFLHFAGDRVSGCNLFALMTPRALAGIAFWDHLDKVRKQPAKLIGAFGLRPLLLYLLGRLSLARAFEEASRRLSLIARPVLMPFAEAAIDVDKPADKELVEDIFAGRSRPATTPLQAAAPE